MKSPGGIQPPGESWSEAVLQVDPVSLRVTIGHNIVAAKTPDIIAIIDVELVAEVADPDAGTERAAANAIVINAGIEQLVTLDCRIDASRRHAIAVPAQIPVAAQYQFFLVSLQRDRV